jgi:hypothetical protein
MDLTFDELQLRNCAEECTTRRRSLNHRGMHRAKALYRTSRSAHRIECTTRQRSLNRRGALTAWRQEPQPRASTVMAIAAGATTEAAGRNTVMKTAGSPTFESSWPPKGGRENGRAADRLPVPNAARRRVPIHPWEAPAHGIPHSRERQENGRAESKNLQIGLIYFDSVGFTLTKPPLRDVSEQRRFTIQCPQPEARLPISVRKGLIYFDWVGFAQSAQSLSGAPKPRPFEIRRPQPEVRPSVPPRNTLIYFDPLGSTLVHPLGGDPRPTPFRFPPFRQAVSTGSRSRARRGTQGPEPVDGLSGLRSPANGLICFDPLGFRQAPNPKFLRSSFPFRFPVGPHCAMGVSHSFGCLHCAPTPATRLRDHRASGPLPGLVRFTLIGLISLDPPSSTFPSIPFYFSFSAFQLFPFRPSHPIHFDRFDSPRSAFRSLLSDFSVSAFQISAFSPGSLTFQTSVSGRIPILP